MPCKFAAPRRGPCPAFEDDRSPRGYCYAHEQIYLHDCAVAYRKKREQDKEAAIRWASSQRLNVDVMDALADALQPRERPYALEIQ
jgi:hypothetical protein